MPHGFAQGDLELGSEKNPNVLFVFYPVHTACFLIALDAKEKIPLSPLRNVTQCLPDGECVLGLQINVRFGDSVGDDAEKNEIIEFDAKEILTPSQEISLLRFGKKMC